MSMTETVRQAAHGAAEHVRTGYGVGKKLMQSSHGSGTHPRRQGKTDLSKWAGALFSLLIFGYIASAIGPDILKQFQLADNSSLQGTAEGQLFSLGGILAAAGILAGVGGMVGLKVFG